MRLRHEWRAGGRPALSVLPGSSLDRASLSETARALAWILAIAVVVRGLFAIGAWLVTKDLTVFHVPDTGTYIAPARELLTRGTFTVGGRPELARTPGYPLLLIPGISVGRLEATTITLQIVLS